MTKFYNDDPNAGDDFHSSCGMISVCCGAPPLGEICDDCGICSQCRDHTTFEQEIEEE